MSAPRILLAIVLACLFTAPAAAQEPVRVGHQHVIGPEPERKALFDFPELFEITRTGEGFLAAWWISGSSHQEFLRFRALDEDGAPAGPVEEFRATSLRTMRLAGDATGAWLVYSGSSVNPVYLQRLSPTGAQVGSPLRVDDTGMVPDVHPQPDGGVLVSFVGVHGGARPVGSFVRRVGPDGAVGPRVRVSGPGESWSRFTLAPVPGGAGVVAVWSERTADGQSTEVFTRRLGADGTPVSAPLQLTASERSIRPFDPESSPILGAAAPTVVYEPSLGQYLVAWVNMDASVGGAQMVARRLDAGGVPLDAAPFAISPRRPPAGGGFYAPRVASDPSTGAWIVTRLASWSAPGGLLHGYEDVLARRLPYASPASSGPDVRIDDPYAGVGPPAIAAGPYGTVAGWFPVSQHMRGPVARRLGAGPDPGVASVSGAPRSDAPRREATLTIASSRAGASLECRIDDGAWKPCAAPWALTGLGDGLRRVFVRSVGPEGWVEPGDGAGASWRVEAAPPTSTFLEVPNPRSRTAQIRFTADEKAKFECRWNRGTWERCFAPEGTYAVLPDGPHTVEVRATDAVGRREAIPARHDWVIDTRAAAATRGVTAPDTTITSGPPVRVRSRSATFTFTSPDAGATFLCALRGVDPAPCSSPHTLVGGEGFNELKVTAVVAGVRDPSPATWRWSANAEPPDTYLLGKPATRAESAYFGWDSDESDEAVRGDCRLDGGAWFECRSPLYLSVPRGSHRFEVRAVDVDGEVDPTPEVHEWFADPVTPAVRITSELYSTNETSASLAFVLDRAGATAECRLDYGAWAPCTSPVRYDELAEGLHRVQVRSSNEGLAGLADEWEWRVDRTPPDTRIVSDSLGDGSRIGSSSVGLGMESRDPGLGYTERFHPESSLEIQCRIDSGPWKRCVESAGFANLADGEHLVEAYAIDDAGNADPTPATFRVVVDTAIPNTTIASGPVTGPGRAAEFTLRAEGETDGFECRLDDAAWDACTTTPRFADLPDGPHRFEARTVRYGRIDASQAVWEWTVGATATPTPTPTATATPTPSPDSTATPEPSPDPLPAPPASPAPTPDRFGGAEQTADAAAPLRAWAGIVSTAVRKGKAGRAVRVRLAAPAPGRLEIRVLDRRGRTLARGSATFAREQRRTLTLRPLRRGARTAVSVRWVPKNGRAQTLRRGL